MSTPLISVITPTWKRHELLVSRCIPSVQAQTYPAVEHIIISDGPDPELRKRIENTPLALRFRRGQQLWYFELPEHTEDKHWGAPARLHGLEYASGEYIAYCDDDDTLRPQHCEVLARALDENPKAGFAVSLLASHAPHGVHEVGHGQISAGNVGTPMIMHRRETLERGTWSEPGSCWEDWDMVLLWLNEEVPYVRVSEITCDSWPSAYRWREKEQT